MHNRNNNGMTHTCKFALGSKIGLIEKRYRDGDYQVGGSSDVKEKSLEWIMNRRAAVKHLDQRKITTERQALLEAIPGWTDDTFTDTCPKCKQQITFKSADINDFRHEHDDGESGTCKFRGQVVKGKIQTKTLMPDKKKCQVCEKLKPEAEYGTDQWSKCEKNAC